MPAIEGNTDITDMVRGCWAPRCRRTHARAYVLIAGTWEVSILSRSRNGAAKESPGRALGRYLGEVGCRWPPVSKAVGAITTGQLPESTVRMRMKVWRDGSRRRSRISHRQPAPGRRARAHRGQKVAEGHREPSERFFEELQRPRAFPSRAGLTVSGRSPTASLSRVPSACGSP